MKSQRVNSCGAECVKTECVAEEEEKVVEVVRKLISSWCGEWDWTGVIESNGLNVK